MSSTAESAIREVLEARARAVGAGDVEGMMADVAEDVVMFDVVSPLRRVGRDAAGARAAEWIASYQGPVTWEQRELEITAGESIAFSHALSRVTGTSKDGNRVDMWLRTTLGFRRDGDRWLITHDHGSVPFDPKSGTAALDLQP